MDTRICLRADDVALVLVTEDGGLPWVLHWGADLGALSDDEATALIEGDRWVQAPNGPDHGLILGVVPEARFGWSGTPGLIGSRDGADWSPDWRLSGVTIDGVAVTDGLTQSGPAVVEYRAEAPASALALSLVVELLPTGLVRAKAQVTNLGESTYRVTELTVSLPVPSEAREILDFGGRWGNERAAQRGVLNQGAHRRESRFGRTGANSAYVLSLGTAGFGYRDGEVWGVHTAHSGHHIHQAQRDYIGANVIGGGELLLPGEGDLATGQSYATPWVYFNYAVGLDQQASRFHRHLRALPVHPETARPVTLNVWEAVYFDHRLDRLTDLADRAAALGVERFVLDDGWFGARRSDDAGLGDWVVSDEMWPNGLTPLIEHVRGLGMQFGLWIEPEMVNLDSDVARAHPEWVMQPGGGRMPISQRRQQVLNLTIPGAYQHVLDQLSAVFADNRIDYIKWDHNRDLIDSGTAPTGRPAVSEQTKAFYRLLDELRARFPHMEWESCASGGGRIDLEVMERAERVWVSDNIDSEERQRMLWWTGQLLPMELMGSHVASGRSHTTARWHDLNFRAATAVFGHFGIEWDLTKATDEEFEQLGWWIRWYKQNRETICTGALVRVDLADPEVYFKGVVAADKAIFSLSMLKVTNCVSLGRLRFPGLDPDARYRVTVIDRQHLPAKHHSQWTKQPLVATGAQLATVGLRAPYTQPSTAVLFELEKIG
ncbi:alpha-galactosidase [Tessaracoccus caeni]|uniref:alpha-galactosidase n=1 Tax=Tessaracoccus caeni TaxID=3031239 RepID=UPI0023DABE1E|nr:alpha-galactosidase [Tessaracoccus caeni]MDF1490165.1 alpha-galactosidase [Tessaracoccus caeni]